jgi:hypothetical protein
MHWGRIGSAAGLGLLLAVGCGPDETEGTVDSDALELTDEEVMPAEEGDLGQHAAALSGATLYAIADADARVDASAPDTNHGDTTRLRMDGAPEAETYLRFSFVGLGGEVNNAKLRLYATSASRGVPQVWPVENGWSESTITWNNRPLHRGPPLMTALPVQDESWVEFDVTGSIQADGTFSFAVGTDAADGASFVSRNSILETLRPVLYVVTEPSDCTPGTLVETAEVLHPDRSFYVSAASPDKKLSRRTSLWVDGDKPHESFLSFLVDPRGRELKRAVLVLHSRDEGTRDPVMLHRVVPGTWEGGSRTWNTRPRTEPTPVATLASVPAYTRVTYDVTDLVREGRGSLGSNGTGFQLELALRSTSPDGVEFYSPYGASHAVWPRLVMYFDQPCP